MTRVGLLLAFLAGVILTVVCLWTFRGVYQCTNRFLEVRLIELFQLILGFFVTIVAGAYFTRYASRRGKGEDFLAILLDQAQTANTGAQQAFETFLDYRTPENRQRTPRAFTRLRAVIVHTGRLTFRIPGMKQQDLKSHLHSLAAIYKKYYQLATDKPYSSAPPDNLIAEIQKMHTDLQTAIWDLRMAIITSE
jgi:hypothetical protein